MGDAVHDDGIVGVHQLVQDAIIAAPRAEEATKLTSERLADTSRLGGEWTEEEFDHGRHYAGREAIEISNCCRGELDAPAAHLADPTP